MICGKKTLETRAGRAVDALGAGLGVWCRDLHKGCFFTTKNLEHIQVERDRDREFRNGFY